MAYYITRGFCHSQQQSLLKHILQKLSAPHIFLLKLFVWYIMMSRFLLLCFVVLPLCLALSSTQNSKLESEIKDLEMLVFWEIPCQNCMLDMRIKYLRLTLDKVLTADPLDHSGNWSQKFVFSLAGQVITFIFNVTIAVLRIYLSFQINKKFKRWEESEEIKLLRKLERMQFPPTADMERFKLPERW